MCNPVFLHYSQRRRGIILGQVRNILLQYVNQVYEIYGNELNTVIFYDSYARGDYNASSDDMDRMILVMPLKRPS